MNPRYSPLLPLAVVCLAVSSLGGGFSSSDFSSPLDSGNIDVAADSIILSIKQYIIDRAYGDAAFEYPKSAPIDSTYSCDVAAMSTDQFSFFWAQPVPGLLTSDDIGRQDVTINDAGYVEGTPSLAFSTTTNRTIYLDVVAGNGTWLLTYADADGQSPRSGPVVLYMDTTIISEQRNPMPSVCYFTENDYLVSYRNHAGSSAYIARVTADSYLADGVSEKVFGGGTIPYVTNPTIATDGNSVLMIRTNGSNASDLKDLYWHLFSSSLVSQSDGFIMERAAFNNVPTAPQDYDFPESQVCSYANRKFAMATWREGEGVFLCTLSVNAGRNSLVEEVTNINPSPTARWATIASNGDVLVVAWKGLMDGDADGTVAVRGAHYTIRNDTIDWASRRNFMFSDTGQNVDINNPGLDIAIDDNGTMAFAWTQFGQATGCVWSYRGERYEEGYWQSPVEQITVTPGDSLEILSGSSTFGVTLGDKVDSIRVGPAGDTAALGWSDWADLSSASELAAKTKNTDTYVQFKTHILRTHRTATPSITSYSYTWNIKPSFDNITSVTTSTLGTVPGLDFGDTVTIYSRLDTVGITYTAHDNDTDHSFFSTVTWLSAMDTTLTGDVNFSGSATLSQVPVSDTVYRASFTGRDDLNWYAEEKNFYVRTQNFVPVVGLRVSWDSDLDGEHDSLLITTPTTIYLQEDDSLWLYYGLQELNDPLIKAYAVVNQTKIDSTTLGVEGAVNVKPGAFVKTLDTVGVIAEDADTSVGIQTWVRVNYFPSIAQTYIDGTAKAPGEPAAIVVGSPTKVDVAVSDANVGVWDTITYQYTTPTIDTVTLDSTLTFSPTESDVWMRIAVRDVFGKADTAMYYFNYPAYDTTLANNEAYGLARDTLAGKLERIVGSNSRDSVSLPFVNTGNTDLSIYPIIFGGANSPWLNVGLWQVDRYVYFDSLRASSPVLPLVVSPGDTVALKIIVDPGPLTGDGVVHDTIYLTTNDPIRPYDTIPVAFEHNELPTIVDLSFDFEIGTHYMDYLPKAKRAMADPAYRFPPHARLALTFSEPMDSASAVGKIRMYSIFDSMETGTAADFVVNQAWDSGYTRLIMWPTYTVPSTYFNGLTPPDGLFMPTDSIRLVISSDITDTARTPSGPNTLDIDGDFVRDVGEDTSFALRVDSIHFRIVNVFPDTNSTGVNIDEDWVRLTFSAPVYPGSVDTSLANNQSLIVTSRHLSRTDPSRQLLFDSVYIDGNEVYFAFAKNFFYGDSVSLHYRSIAARDSSGYPVDLSADGIPMAIFDSSSTVDDLMWYFLVKDIYNTSVSPANEENNVSIFTPISLFFSNSVEGSLIDSSLVGNQSLIVTSNYSNGRQLTYDSIVVVDTTATFFLTQRLFYSDSVHCFYKGLVTGDSTLFSVVLSGDTLYNTTDDRQWYFEVEPLSLERVSPDSASTGETISTSISMEFSGPIFPQIFDTSMIADSNTSFVISTARTGRKPIAYDRISFSSDSATVTFYPSSKFFAADSVFCDFAGFSNDFRYGTGLSYLPSSGGAANSPYSWFFVVENAGFYTYPNPYKPGSDRRHRELGGIWFKNLHRVGTTVARLRLKVYTMNTHPVFDSDKAGTPIVLKENGVEREPSWFWNTRNTHGDLLGSGVYLYALYDNKDTILKKGKILIVR